jgi:poly(hydroxyalkanoate) depolymerase family esterase
MKFSIRALSAVATVTAVVATSLTFASPASAASLVEVTNFGPNPTNLRMHLYVPDTVRPQPAVLVAAHFCTGSGPVFYSGTEFASLADQHGFIVIYPSATRSGNCFDVSSPQALQHNGGSDPVGVVSMVNYVLQNHDGDPDRVYITGLSSGAMLTNVMLGAYPDVFNAGAAFAGVPYACFATTDGSMWNTTCANGQLIRTPQEWGNLVRGAFPGYTGARPRMQIWHGTADDTLRYPNFGEQIKQWTNVHGLSQTPSFTDSPQPNWTRTRYGGTGTMAPVEAISIQGGPHNILMNGMAARVIQFLGLDQGGNQQDPPAAPAGLTATSTATSVSLSWNPSPGATSYQIQRAPATGNEPFVQVGTTSGSSFTNTGLPSNATFLYRVTASNAVGTSPPSNTVTVTTQPGGTNGGCTAVGTVQNQWQNGYVVQPVTVTNTGTSAISGWTVTFTLPAGHSVVGYWNAQLSGQQSVTATNLRYNGPLAPNASTSFGFQVSRPSGNSQTPASYACTAS